jgi:hypothetical protein
MEKEERKENNDIGVQFLLSNVTRTLVCAIFFSINIYTLLIPMMNELSMKLLFMLLAMQLSGCVCFSNDPERKLLIVNHTKIQSTLLIRLRHCSEGAQCMSREL